MNDTLLDGQMGLLNRRSYVVHPLEPLSITAQSPSFSSHSWFEPTSNSYSHPSTSNSSSETAKGLIEGFTYIDTSRRWSFVEYTLLTFVILILNIVINPNFGGKFS